MFGDRAAEIVVRRNGVDLDSRVLGDPAKVTAAGRGEIDRVAVRPLPIDFDPRVAVFAGARDHLLQRERRAAIPDT